MVKFSRLDFSQYSMNRRAGCICDLVSKSVISLISFGRFNTIPYLMSCSPGGFFKQLETNLLTKISDILRVLQLSLRRTNLT